MECSRGIADGNGVLIHAKVDLKVDILYTMLDKLPAFFLPGRDINQNGHDMIQRDSMLPRCSSEL
jgi:hypothetical protein